MINPDFTRFLATIFRYSHHNANLAFQGIELHNHHLSLSDFNSSDSFFRVKKANYKEFIKIALRGQ